MLFNEEFSQISIIAVLTIVIVTVGISIFKVRDNYLKNLSEASNTKSVTLLSTVETTSM